MQTKTYPPPPRGEEDHQRRQEVMALQFSEKGRASGEGWGLSFLLVLSPDSYLNPLTHQTVRSSPSHDAVKNKGTTTTKPSFILSNTYIIISICLVFTMFSIFAFTLSVLEPTRSLQPFPRKMFQEKRVTTSGWNSHGKSAMNRPLAFQGMGILFRKGSRAMEELIVAHLPEDTREEDFRLFTRALYMSCITSKSDVVFISGSSSSSWLSSVIDEEEASFFELLRRSNWTLTSHGSCFLRKGRGRRESFWGLKRKVVDGKNFSYGSVVGFSTSELEPENSLAGVAGHEPTTNLRRWACYTMLLGRLRRRYKRVLLLDVKETVVVGDPFVAVRGHSVADFVILHRKRDVTVAEHIIFEDDESRWRRSRLESGVIVGGERGVRRLARYMAVGMVRAAAEATANGGMKKKELSESEVLSQLVGGGLISDRVDVLISEEVFPAARDMFSPEMVAGGVVLRGEGGREFTALVERALSFGLNFTTGH